MNLRLIHFPPWPMENPYLRMFYEALEARGIETSGEFELSLRWLYRVRDEVDIIHIHWPEYLWRPHSWRALVKLFLLLILMRPLSVRLAWTVHNVEPHRGSGRADRLGFWLLGRFSDLIICHSGSAAEAVRQRLDPKGRMMVMPHGSYAGWYPPPHPRRSVLKDLGLSPEKPVIACVGYIREYKDIPTACAAAGVLGEEVQLLIAGEPDYDFDLAGLRACVETLPSAVLIARSLTDQELVDMVTASDLVLLPYRNITGSGALLMAWTLQRAVVATDLPYFRQMVPDHSAAGWLFEPGNPLELAGCIRSALDTPADARAAAAAGQADLYSWNRCVEPVADVMWTLCRSRTRRQR